MPDSLAEIRARLDAATPEWDYENDLTDAVVEFINRAPADIAWLLDALANEQRHSSMLIERIDALHLENVRLRGED